MLILIIAFFKLNRYPFFPENDSHPILSYIEKNYFILQHIYTCIYTSTYVEIIDVQKEKKGKMIIFEMKSHNCRRFICDQPKALVTRHAHSSTQGMTPHPEGYSSFAECIKCKYITKRHVICALHLEGKNHPVAYQLLVNN